MFSNSFQIIYLFAKILTNYEFMLSQSSKKVKGRESGDAGYRSPYLSHAKRALYHLSYIPLPLPLAASV